MLLSELASYKNEASTIGSQLKALKDTQSRRRQSDAMLDVWRAELKTRNDKIERLINSLASASFNEQVASRINQQITTMDEECREYQSKIEEEELTIQRLDDDQNRIISIERVIDKYLSTAKTLSVPERRDSLYSFIRRIEWDGENLDIFI